MGPSPPRHPPAFLPLLCPLRLSQCRALAHPLQEVLRTAPSTPTQAQQPLEGTMFPARVALHRLPTGARQSPGLSGPLRGKEGVPGTRCGQANQPRGGQIHAVIGGAVGSLGCRLGPLARGGEEAPTPGRVCCPGWQQADLPPALDLAPSGLGAGGGEMSGCPGELGGPGCQARALNLPAFWTSRSPSSISFSTWLASCCGTWCQRCGCPSRWPSASGT